MLKLFETDLRVCAVFLWVVVPLYLVTALTTSGFGGVYFWINVTIACQLLVGVSMLDWKNDAARFILSLPVTRATAVKARYATAVLIGLASLAVGALVGLSRALVLTTRGQPWPRWMAADVGLAFVFVFAFIVAIYLPCYFRWGYGKGAVAAALILASTIVASDVLWPFVLGTVSGAAAGGDDLPRGSVAHGVALLASRLGLAAAGIVVMGAAAVMLWLSAQASVRAYQRREF
jgi:hypothetical protein